MSSLADSEECPAGLQVAEAQLDLVHQLVDVFFTEARLLATEQYLLLLQLLEARLVCGTIGQVIDG